MDMHQISMTQTCGNVVMRMEFFLESVMVRVL